ncbi:MAG: damage-inducible protein CinA [Comamonadaceae bacterium CG_4_9_14_3_um_filter_60_33]|nr:MAG: damage-inducible protein CinA [Comamonadaceae bacterium CG_4_10_14_3_um_filter_60_42]PJB41022.1 MAG: damage-inducible protein CinA [Comamonadaceae bacterium CG_4_9_14_3_um_filter_60_33]
MTAMDHTPSAASSSSACATLASLLLERRWLLCTAESCTGGLIAAACTDLAGSSNWFERGFVTYSNAAKIELLGVDAALIERHGAVSEAVARAMATGALAYSRAQVAIAVTGVAGPTGGSADKPVGTVWFGFALPGGVRSELQRFEGDRAGVRQATVQHALNRLNELLQSGA